MEQLTDKMLEPAVAHLNMVIQENDAKIDSMGPMAKKIKQLLTANLKN